MNTRGGCRFYGAEVLRSCKGDGYREVEGGQGIGGGMRRVGRGVVGR